jgi:hypothetical protein
MSSSLEAMAAPRVIYICVYVCMYTYVRMYVPSFIQYESFSDKLVKNAWMQFLLFVSSSNSDDSIIKKSIF